MTVGPQFMKRLLLLPATLYASKRPSSTMLINSSQPTWVVTDCVVSPRGRHWALAVAS